MLGREGQQDLFRVFSALKVSCVIRLVIWFVGLSGLLRFLVLLGYSGFVGFLWF